MTGNNSSSQFAINMLTSHSLLDPFNITTPPPLASTSKNKSGISNSLLGAIISLAVLIPIGLAIFLLWLFKLRKVSLITGVRNDLYARQTENKDKAATYAPKFAELETPMSARNSQLPFRQGIKNQPTYEMPAFEMDATSIYGKNKVLPIPR